MGCPIKGRLEVWSKEVQSEWRNSSPFAFADLIHPVRKEQIEIVAPVPQEDNYGDSSMKRAIKPTNENEEIIGRYWLYRLLLWC